MYIRQSFIHMIVISIILDINVTIIFNIYQYKVAFIKLSQNQTLLFIGFAKT